MLNHEVEHFFFVSEVFGSVFWCVVSIGREWDFLVSKKHQLNVVCIGLELPKSIRVVLISFLWELIPDMDDVSIAQEPTSLTTQFGIVVIEFHYVFHSILPC